MGRADRRVHMRCTVRLTVLVRGGRRRSHTHPHVARRPDTRLNTHRCRFRTARRLRVVRVHT